MATLDQTYQTLDGLTDFGFRMGDMRRRKKLDEEARLERELAREMALEDRRIAEDERKWRRNQAMSEGLRWGSDFELRKRNTLTAEQAAEREAARQIQADRRADEAVNLEIRRQALAEKEAERLAALEAERKQRQYNLDYGRGLNLVSESNRQREKEAQAAEQFYAPTEEFVFDPLEPDGPPKRTLRQRLRPGQDSSALITPQPQPVRQATPSGAAARDSRPQVRTMEEVNRLPKGTEFIWVYPDGTTRLGRRS